jgi:cellulose synthase/poly-beta-1,6-N-acetylglucosamine synthase-like glycosyltransferase
MNALSFLLSLDQVSLILLFWYTAVLDIPRFTIGAIVVAALAPFSRPRAADGSAAQRSASVILVGHNEAHALPACVTSLWEQTIAGTPGRMQVIVVDDGSSDSMFAEARALQQQGKVQEIFRLHHRGGKSAGVNLAIGAASGDIVIIADIDTTFDRDACEVMLGYFEDPKVGAVSGNLGVRNASASLIASHQAVEYAIGISLGRRVMDALGILSIASGAFGAFRRVALDDVGRQDVEVGEDADLTMKLRRSGWRIRFAAGARALTDVPTTLSGLTAQRLRWDRGLVTIWARKFRGAVDPRHAAFRLLDMLAVADILLFQIALPLIFPVYLVWLFHAVGDLAPTVILATLIVYAALDGLAFVTAAALDGSRLLGLIVYVPLYTLMQISILRIIRIAAVMQELIFRSSYRDPYVPRRVMQQVERV